MQFTTNHERLNSIQFNFTNFIWLDWFYSLFFFASSSVFVMEKKIEWRSLSLQMNLQIEGEYVISFRHLSDGIVWRHRGKRFEAPSFYHITEYITFHKTNVCTGYRTQSSVWYCANEASKIYWNRPSTEYWVLNRKLASCWMHQSIDRNLFQHLICLFFWCWWCDSRRSITMNFEIVWVTRIEHLIPIEINVGE